MVGHYIDKYKELIQKDIFFLGIIFLFGWLLIFPYGAHMDQEFEMRILYSNYVSYCEQLGLNGSMYQEMIQDGVINIKDSIEKDHGMAVFYPLIWIWKLNQRSSFLGNLLWHHYVYFICFLGVLSLFYLIKKMFGRKTALIVTAIYFFTPRMFAEFHYNNIDLVVLSLSLIVYYSGWKLAENTNLKNIFVFAVEGAFLANIRIIGLFLWGMTGIAVLLIKIKKKEFQKELLFKIVLCAAAAFFVFCLVTPASWKNLGGYMEYVLAGAGKYVMWDGYVLFQGRLYSPPNNPLPAEYLPVMMLITLPVGVIILAGAGIFRLIWRMIKEKDVSGKIIHIYSACIFLCGGIPVVYAVLARPTLYNCWRHFYFVYGAVIILCAQAVNGLFKESGENGSSIRADRAGRALEIGRDAAFAVYIAGLIVGICINHPFEYAYYNIFAGKNVEENFELDYWDLSYKQAFDYLADNCQGEISYCTFDDITSRMGIQIQMPVIRGKDRGRFVLADRWEDADYVVVNTTYVRMYGEEDYQKLKENFEICKVFSSYGNRVCEIYSRRPELQQHE